MARPVGMAIERMGTKKKGGKTVDNCVPIKK